MEFREITNENIWKICMLEVFDNQKDFVAENIQSLAEAYATRNEGNNALPYGIYIDGQPIGFIMIGKGTVGNKDESKLIKENYCLWRLMIDKNYQHKGYGKMAISKTLDMMKNDEFKLGKSKYCWLSYELENIVAKELYLKMGFKEINEMCGNEIMAVLELE